MTKISSNPYKGETKFMGSYLEIPIIFLSFQKEQHAKKTFVQFKLSFINFIAKRGSITGDFKDFQENHIDSDFSTSMGYQEFFSKVDENKRCILKIEKS